jgi:hypothetical protein
MMGFRIRGNVVDTRLLHETSTLSCLSFPFRRAHDLNTTVPDRAFVASALGFDGSPANAAKERTSKDINATSVAQCDFIIASFPFLHVPNVHLEFRRFSDVNSKVWLAWLAWSFIHGPV